MSTAVELLEGRFSFAGQCLTIAGMDLPHRIKTQILAELERRGWSKADLVRHSKLNKTTVYEILGKTPRIPRQDARAALERTLDIKIAADGESEPPPVEDLSSSLQGNIDTVRLSGIPEDQMAPAIDFAVLEQIPIELEGEELMAEIRTRRYGKRPTDTDAPGLFWVRLSADLGRYKAGRCLLINRFMTPEAEEHVLIKFRKRRRLGEYGLDEDGTPTVALWGDGGGTARGFDLIGTVVEANYSTLKRPR